MWWVTHNAHGAFAARGVLRNLPADLLDSPPRITATIETTEPVVKGQTASSSYKPAMLDIGVKTMVPPHIGTGTRIIVNTEDGAYVERAKD